MITVYLCRSDAVKYMLHQSGERGQLFKGRAGLLSSITPPCDEAECHGPFTAKIITVLHLRDHAEVDTLTNSVHAVLVSAV